MKTKQKRDGGFNPVEFLIIIVILAILAVVTIAAVAGFRNKRSSGKAPSNSIVEWAATIAPIPANAPTMSEETWALLIYSAANANLDFNILHSGVDNLGRSAGSGGKGYALSFTRILETGNKQLRACIPPDGSETDSGYLALLHYANDKGFVARIGSPVMREDNHPYPHAITVALSADSDEQAGRQGIDLFKWIDKHPLGCKL